MLLSLVLTFLLVATVKQEVSAFDPCLSSEHQDIPHLIGRSTNCPQAIKSFCDNYLLPGWYKVPLHTPMPTTCVEINSCGAAFPIWMNGTFPRVTEGIVEREACMTYFDNCCADTIPIKMKHCSTFLVYWLDTADSCPLMYCFGTDGICEETTTVKTTTAQVAETTTVSEGNDGTDGISEEMSNVETTTSQEAEVTGVVEGQHHRSDCNSSVVLAAILTAAFLINLATVVFTYFVTKKEIWPKGREYIY
ncbi:hypothetical protein ScPMuIL_008975 [Solemya velum]